MLGALYRLAVENLQHKLRTQVWFKSKRAYMIPCPLKQAYNRDLDAVVHMFKKKLVSDKDFVMLYDCLNNVRRSAKYDEYDVFKKNALKIDDIMNGVDRKNYAAVVRKLIVYDHKWEVCFTEPNRDIISIAVEAFLNRDNFSPLTIGRSLVKAIREFEANGADLYGRFLTTMELIANSTLPATMGDRTIIIDGNRTSAAGSGFPHCFMDIDAFTSKGRCAIPVWTDGFESKLFGLAVCEY